MPTRNVQVLVAAGLLLSALAVFWAPNARSQINASPSWVPIGVSSSGNASTAWFQEPSSRQTAACQTVSTQASGITAIQCVTAKLP